ncbi:LacI family transcriptional regulator [Terrabacter sp. Root85]|uniref:LacI family DNA-binding transcriptional regulator n=1 Tax=unclassified Terrabacter TaxID=2630222 RepID=UPI0006F7068D|nr:MULTISPECIES: LacI family DNA-binding transcriptional regulator [unclassified Terrabacter]KRC92082.1 LacI family transcriptional regulator [Terrabacter sp. Root85]KRF48767.1 LacI family transcriptional regulator [Terrabacter sp. Soil811]
MAQHRARSHRVRDIAEQSGLSEATIDRVLHGRAGASARAVRAVEQAVLDLDRQQTQLRLAARTLLLDVVVQAPTRFSTAVRSALEDELPALRPAAVRARFHLRENADVAAAVEVLDSLGRRGRVCHGVVLKAPDDPAVAAAVGRLADRGIPVVTLVTDVRDSARVAYVGLDNAAAGATAAYLVSQVLGDRPGDVLLSLSRSFFFGERERAEAFTVALGRLAPDRRVHTITDSDGLDATMSALVSDVLRSEPEVRAAYSVGGGNRAISAAFVAAGRPPGVFIGHDLDEDNLDLLRSGVLTAVLHHDLHADMRAGVRQVMRAHRLVPGAPTSVAANVEVVTAYNIPPRIHAH